MTEVPNSVRLYTALDLNDQMANCMLGRRIARESGDHGFKVGLDHILVWGIDYLRHVIDIGKPVFADVQLKNDIRVSTNIMEALVKTGVEHVTVDAGLGATLRPLVEIAKGSKTKVLASTVPTYFDDQQTRAIHRCMVDTAVHSLAMIGLEHGCDGVMAPGTTLQTLAFIKRSFPNAQVLVPGIRPKWYASYDLDQHQIVTPTQAVERGANMLVVGRPIIRDRRPVLAFQRVLDEITDARVRAARSTKLVKPEQVITES